MSERAVSSKSAGAYRTISEVAEDLGLPQHVLRFWETRFPQVKPLKRAGGRRFYRPEDVDLLRAVQALLYGDGYTIKGVQRMLREQGSKAISNLTATLPVVERGDHEGVSTMVGEARSPSADGSVGLSPPDWQVVLAEEAVSERDGRPVVPQSSLESATRVSHHIGVDIVERLQAVLSDLAACEHIICRVQNPSLSS